MTPELIVADVGAWRRWLSDHGSEPNGVWLVLAKKGATDPTSLTYGQALDEALCHGWIDGQVDRRDADTYRRRFTPRRAGSAWSKRNVGIVRRLTAERRMRPAGLDAVTRAKGDGTWDAAYAGSATIEVPDDFAAALAANPKASQAFLQLNATDRYTILYRITSARRKDTRAKRTAEFVAMLAEGKTILPPR